MVVLGVPIDAHWLFWGSLVVDPSTRLSAVILAQTVGWIELDCIGLDWIGLDWIGLDWIGLAWIGWLGLDWLESLLLTLMPWLLTKLDSSLIDRLCSWLRFPTVTIKVCETSTGQRCNRKRVRRTVTSGLVFHHQIETTIHRDHIPFYPGVWETLSAKRCKR